jgi:photoactive yellow protein
MTLSGNVPRRTLPAPHERVDLETIRAERDVLKAENEQLRAEIRRLEALVGVGRHVPEPVPAFESDPLPPPSRTPFGFDALFADGQLPTGGPLFSEPSPSTGLDFGTVSKLSDDDLDKLPYGLICLDAQGRVVRYNDTEARLAGLPKERVIGRSFFSEVAPCTRVREFEGEFHDLVRDPSRVRVRSFDFVFRFRHSEQHVTIVMTPARTRGLYNLALLRRRIVKK